MNSEYIMNKSHIKLIENQAKRLDRGDYLSGESVNLENRGSRQTRTYEKITENDNLYRTTQITIPKPDTKRSD